MLVTSPCPDVGRLALSPSWTLRLDSSPWFSGVPARTERERSRRNRATVDFMELMSA